MQLRVLAFILTISILSTLSSFTAEPVETLTLWPREPPGPAPDAGSERIVEGGPRPFYQITGVSQPTLSVYLPPKERRTGAAILLCPGGGLQRLAIEHEGFEAVEWLTSLDIAVFLLKYRVPAPVTAALQDAQRALSLIRARANEWEVDPDEVGVLGFSAGGEIAVWLATQERQYEALDEADSISSRPAFAALIYPGGLLERRNQTLKEGILTRLGPATPPMFLVHAFGDSSENSLHMMLALKKARVPAELHIFQQGGHGFGVRSSGNPLNAWKELFLVWSGSQGFLDPAFVRGYAKDFQSAIETTGPLPRFSAGYPRATLTEAYAVQDRLARKGDQIAGYKGAAVSRAALDALDIEKPLTGVLFRSGRLAANPSPVIDATAAGGRMVETEIGYLVSVDISYHVLNDEQARGAVEGIVPVIELPADLGRRLGPMTASDMAAVNISSAQYIVGTTVPPEKIDPNTLKISLKHDGNTLHETQGDTAAGGQWATLRTIINELVDRGHTIAQGSLIISGALGKVHPGEPGRYDADFGELGSISFELK